MKIDSWRYEILDWIKSIGYIILASLGVIGVFIGIFIGALLRILPFIVGVVVIMIAWKIIF